MIVIRLIQQILRWIQFSFYKSIAIANWKVTGKRQWVLMIKGTNRMMILNNDQIRAYNTRARKKHYKQLDLPTLMKEALYGTPAGNTGERKRK